jgi:hypothetical protein
MDLSGCTEAMEMSIDVSDCPEAMEALTWTSSVYRSAMCQSKS